MSTGSRLGIPHIPEMAVWHSQLQTSSLSVNSLISFPANTRKYKHFQYIGISCASRAVALSCVALCWPRRPWLDNKRLIINRVKLLWRLRLCQNAHWDEGFSPICTSEESGIIKRRVWAAPCPVCVCWNNKLHSLCVNLQSQNTVLSNTMFWKVLCCWLRYCNSWHSHDHLLANWWVLLMLLPSNKEK